MGTSSGRNLTVNLSEYAVLRGESGASRPDKSESEDDEEKKRITEERLKAYHEKKSQKKAVIAKTSVLLDVKVGYNLFQRVQQKTVIFECFR